MASVHLLAASVQTRQFENVGMEVLSSVIHLIGVSVLSYLLALKLQWSELASFQLNRVTWPKLLIILTLIDSWAFQFTTGVLVHGTGMELNGTVCVMGILNCIIFYASSKILIYLFLAEKVYVVWTSSHRQRFRSKVYLGCLAVIIIYVGVIGLMIWGRIAFFRGDGACVIGLTRAASLTLLIYDLCINIVLTGLFVWPLLDRQFTTALKGVAIRTLWAAGVALTTSCVNILVLTIMHGQQLAWVCLASCGTDVVINAAILCWVTSGHADDAVERSQEPSGGPDPKNYTSNIVLYHTSDDAPHSGGIRARFPRVFDAVTRRASTSNGSKHPRTTDSDVELSSVGDVADRKGTRSLGFIDELDDSDSHRSQSARFPRGPPFADIRPLPRAHSSMLKRSNTAVARHTTSHGSIGEGALQIIVTRETDVQTDRSEQVPLPLPMQDRTPRFPPPSTPSPSPPESVEKLEKW